MPFRHLHSLPFGFRPPAHSLCRLLGSQRGLQMLPEGARLSAADQVPVDSITKKYRRHGAFGQAGSMPGGLPPNPPTPPTPADTDLVPLIRAGIIHSFPPGMGFGLTSKNPKWHDTNGTANLGGESPNAHRLGELGKAWKSKLPDDVRSEVLFIRQKEDSDKYLAALQNGDRGILAMRKTQIRELICLIHTLLWYQMKPKMPNTNNTVEQSPQPDSETDGQASPCVTNKTTSNSIEDDEDDGDDENVPWDSDRTISYKEHRGFLKAVEHHQVLLHYLNTPLPPIINRPRPQQEEFNHDDILLVPRLLAAGPKRLLNLSMHQLTISDAIELVQWLESCSEEDLNKLGIWGKEPVIQRNTLTKFARHLLGIGRGTVDWDSAKQAAEKQKNDSLVDRVRDWREQTAGLPLQTIWKKWSGIVLEEKLIRGWKKQHRAGYSTTREELNNIDMKKADQDKIDVALGKKADQVALDETDVTVKRILDVLAWITPMIQEEERDKYGSFVQALKGGK